MSSNVFGCFKRNAALRKTGELEIAMPALKRPTLEELQANCSSIKSIERDTSPERPVTLTLATVLPEGSAASISGAEYATRLVPRRNLLLGFQHCRWLLEHQKELPAFSHLLWKMVYIDFPGLVVVVGNLGPSIQCAYPRGVRWSSRWRCFDDFDADVRVAAARS